VLKGRVSDAARSSSRSGAFFRTVFSSGALFAHAGAPRRFQFFFRHYHFDVSQFTSPLYVSSPTVTSSRSPVAVRAR